MQEKNAINYQLFEAHESYHEPIISILNYLNEKYPQAGLRKVSLFYTGNTNRSLGNADIPGEIKFNSYWFTKPISVLADEAATNYVVTINGQKQLWHGLMIKEPQHVIVHEFGHVLKQKHPEWNEWTQAGWRYTTFNPDEAITAYAITNPSEYFAECFAAYELNLAPDDLMNSMHKLLAGA